MNLQQHPARHIASVVNPALIESWCLECGVFIAASNDPGKLRTAEESHLCRMASFIPETQPQSKGPQSAK